MGHMIEEVALSRGHEIVCVIDTNPTPGSSTDSHRQSDRAELFTRSREGAKYYTPEDGFESEAFRSADVAIEFTTPATAEENIRKAWAQGVPVISGSTGWKPEKLKIINYKLKMEDNKIVITNEQGKVMLVWSSNFSVGVNIFFELNKFLAQKMKNLTPTLSTREGGYTPSIKEIHHIHKLDKPSGTAKTLAEDLSLTLSQGEGTKVSIESIREGEVPGTHEVTWDSEEDTIVITHIAKGRRGFALGAVLAAEKIVG